MAKRDNGAEGSFSRRVTGDFTWTLMELLQEKSLESISVTELCRHCSYPRSTFYNHFEDIYAVMDACWEIVASEAELDRFQEIPHQERTVALFSMLYAYAREHEETLRRLMVHNRPDGAMCRSLNAYMRRSIARMVEQCPGACAYAIPLPVVAEHYGNTVWMLLERSFIKHDRLDRETAVRCLEYLLGTLERENESR